MENEIKVNFKRSKSVIAKGLWQWDYGQILMIEGITLPSEFEVHFANAGDATAVIVEGSDYTANIPDALLTTGRDIVAYIYLHEGTDDGETVCVAHLPVQKRPQPDDGSNILPPIDDPIVNPPHETM